MQPYKFIPLLELTGIKLYSSSNISAKITANRQRMTVTLTQKFLFG